MLMNKPACYWGFSSDKASHTVATGHAMQILIFSLLKPSLENVLKIHRMEIVWTFIGNRTIMDF